jgi:hypothetical protein
MLFCRLFTLRPGSVNAYHPCKKVQPNGPLFAPWKALRWQGQASAGSVPGSEVSALEAAGGVPSVSVVVGGHEVPKTSASPPPNPTPSARVVLSEAEVEQPM